MTNEKARDLLAMIKVKEPGEFIVNSWWGSFVNDYKEALQMAIEALEQQPCDDWYDVPSDEMTFEQARQAVKDLRKKLAEYLEKNRENLINQRATTCRHGGHCEWVACDKCNHYEPDALSQQPCEDVISRQVVLDELNRIGRNAFKDDTDYDNLFDFVDNLQLVNPKQKTGHWIFKNDNIAIPMGYYQCSECEEGKVLHKDNFCPTCGMRMQEVGE